MYYSVPHYNTLKLSILMKKVITWWWCGGVVYLTDYRTTPGCSTLFYSVQLWIVAISTNVVHPPEMILLLFDS